LNVGHGEGCWEMRIYLFGKPANERLQISHTTTCLI